MSPEVSVLMSVYNGEKYLMEAVQSVLRQTFSDFEFIIIDDASVDSSSQILTDFAKLDQRFKIITNKKNLGLTKSLNIGLKNCQGKYVARLDADDVCEPERLEKQFYFMKNNQAVVLCGTQGFYLDEKSNKIGQKNLPTNYQEIKSKLLFNNQFIHSSLFFKKEMVEREGLYNEYFQTSQDYELILRLACKYPVANLSERLVGWRVGKNSLSWTSKKQEWDAIRARYWAISKYGYAKIQGILNMVLRLVYLLLPQSLKRQRYEN